MSYQQGLQPGAVIRLSGFSFLLLAILCTASYAQPAASPAEEARNKCDALASHPRDPDRYLAGVPDEQLAPGPAREACELAVRLSPDVARLWFQLGRVYWSVGRDADAFKAFIEAARRGHAAAKKYLGDAYLLGRGLPTGENQSAQRALELYRQSADGHFSDAAIAIREVEVRIRDDARAAAKAQAEAEANRFDPSIFQNPRIMAALYYADKDKQSLRGSNYFTIYISSFIGELDNKVIFLEGGAECKPLISGSAHSSNTNDMVDRGTHAGLLVSPFGQTRDPNALDTATLLQATNQGSNDALTLFNRYHCKSEVTTTIMNNINAIYDVGAMHPGISASPPAPGTGGPPAPGAGGGSPGVELASVVSPQLNVRSAPNRNGPLTGRLNANQSVRILRHLGNGWVEIKAVCEDGTDCQGFVNGDYLRSAAP